MMGGREWVEGARERVAGGCACWPASAGPSTAFCGSGMVVMGLVVVMAVVGCWRSDMLSPALLYFSNAMRR